MKTSRKIFCWIIVFAMFLTIMAPVFAATEYGMTWEISDDGVLTITGVGDMRSIPWESQAETVTKIVIGEGIRTIRERAFLECTNLREIVLPSTLQVIEGYAFGSKHFVEFHIPASVAEIAYSAFRECKNLERFVVDSENPYFASDSFGVIYSKDMSMLLYAPPAIQGSYTIPGTVKSVGGEYSYSYPHISTGYDRDVRAEFRAFK